MGAENFPKQSFNRRNSINGAGAQCDREMEKKGEGTADISNVGEKAKRSNRAQWEKKKEEEKKKARAEPLDFFLLLLCVQRGAVWGNLIQDASVPYSPQKGIKLLGVREKNEQR